MWCAEIMFTGLVNSLFLSPARYARHGLFSHPVLARFYGKLKVSIFNQHLPFVQADL